MKSSKAASKSIEIAERVYLKPAATGDAFHYYFTLHGKQFRASTKTCDKAKATRIALNAFHVAFYNYETGKIKERLSFKSLSKRYIDSLKGQTKQKFHQDIINRHFMKFFSRFNDVSRINQGALSDYLLYRKKKSNFTVLNQSLNKENTVFNQMMRFALDYEWISKHIKIKHQSEAQSHNRRPHFTLKQYGRLVQVSERRKEEILLSAKKNKDIGLLTVKHWNRSILHEIIMIIANTGLRVDEVKTVRWKDIDWEKKEIKLHHAGKTRSTREIHVRDEAFQALRRIKEKREFFLQRSGKSLDEFERIQSLPNGQYIDSMKKGFNELLKECGFVYETIKDKHSLTSLRHTYATFRLTDKNGKRASARALSKQMGTSEKMIEKHYGHDDIRDYKDIL